MNGFYLENTIEVGCDEAGRGCLAGAVFAAAVILPENFDFSKINDSKKLSEKQRSELRELIIEKSLAWSVAQVSQQEIDKINILNASILAMHRAIDNLKIEPKHIIIDGNRFKKYKEIPHLCIVKGDAKYASIAAASILAKTFRDDYMMNLHEKYPVYAWNSNKGYPTEVHRKAIEIHGISEFHRRSFKLKDDQLTLKF